MVIEGPVEKMKSILSCGISLHDFGVNNWALTKAQALVVFNKLEQENRSVLGGDVFQIVNGMPESNYDNWYCDRLEGEDSNSYSSRSISIACQYVYQYQHPNGKEALFVLVVE